MRRAAVVLVLAVALVGGWVAYRNSSLWPNDPNDDNIVTDFGNDDP